MRHVKELVNQNRRWLAIPALALLLSGVAAATPHEAAEDICCETANCEGGNVNCAFLVEEAIQCFKLGGICI